MFCTNCGNQLQDESKFCPFCGTKVNDENVNSNTGNNSSNSYSAGSVMGTKFFVPLQTDRNIIYYILLSLVTCGIYHYIFIYRLAEDLNTACEGDGDTTPGLVTYFLLSVVTCGIYAWYWHYKVGNRLQINARRYGMEFPENGTSVLLWMLLGTWCFGIGAFIAVYIIIKNMNLLSEAYNNYNMNC